MDTARCLARLGAGIGAILVGIPGLAVSGAGAYGAIYSPDRWTVTPEAGHQTLDPAEVNKNFGSEAQLSGVFVAGILLERGLVEPAVSHWLQLRYQIGSVEGTVASNQNKLEQRVSYASLIPLGATAWFARTAYIDLGASIGLGLVLSPVLTQLTTTTSGGTTVSQFTALAGPLAEGKIHGRFWLNSYLGLHFTAALTWTSLRLANLTSAIQADFTGYSASLGMTLAIGGIQGTGRRYVEVLPP